SQQHDILIKRLNLALKLDAIHQVNGHRNVLPAQGVEEGILQKLAFIAHDILRVQKFCCKPTPYHSRGAYPAIEHMALRRKSLWISRRLCPRRGCEKSSFRSSTVYPQGQTPCGNGPPRIACMRRSHAPTSSHGSR